MARNLGAGSNDPAEALRVLKAAMTTATPEAVVGHLTSIMRIGNVEELPFCLDSLRDIQIDSEHALSSPRFIVNDLPSACQSALASIWPQIAKL